MVRYNAPIILQRILRAHAGELIASAGDGRFHVNISQARIADVFRRWHGHHLGAFF